MGFLLSKKKERTKEKFPPTPLFYSKTLFLPPTPRASTLSNFKLTTIEGKPLKNPLK